jgi:hypothetical protein
MSDFDWHDMTLYVKHDNEEFLAELIKLTSLFHTLPVVESSITCVVVR